MKCVCDHCEMTILANDPWCSVCYKECRKMKFTEIFDREASIAPGLMPIWLVLSVLFMFKLPNGLENSFGTALAPVGFLIGLHWLFQFGEWLFRKLRK